MYSKMLPNGNVLFHPLHDRSLACRPSMARVSNPSTTRALFLRAKNNKQRSLRTFSVPLLWERRQTSRGGTKAWRWIRCTSDWLAAARAVGATARCRCARRALRTRSSALADSLSAGLTSGSMRLRAKPSMRATTIPNVGGSARALAKSDTFAFHRIANLV